MSRSKALTVAIAGALAAPLAAQAVDFTLSGQVSRTLFIVDKDTPNSTKGEIKDNNGATRARANGSSALEDGSTIGIQFEYGLDADVTLRHANVQYTNPVAGRITIGQGSEAGDGSAGLGPGVTGLGAGQAGTSLGAYFNSLDGGSRTNMVRYDTPSIGPMRAAVSVGNNDSFSGLLALSGEFAGSSFGAQVGTHHMPRPDAPSTRDPSTVSASAGLTLANGLSVGGAWGKGEELVGMAAMPITTVRVTGDDTAVTAGMLAAINAARPGTANDLADAAALEGLSLDKLTAADRAAAAKYAADNACNEDVGDATTVGGAITTEACSTVLVSAARAETSVDPSYFRMGIGYTFGGTTVAASWYNSEDFVMTGSDGTAYGIGASHTLPKVGATFHASVQNYKVELPGVSKDMKETVIQIGTLVTF